MTDLCNKCVEMFKLIKLISKVKKNENQCLDLMLYNMFKRHSKNCCLLRLRNWLFGKVVPTIGHPDLACHHLNLYT